MDMHSSDWSVRFMIVLLVFLQWFYHSERLFSVLSEDGGSHRCSQATAVLMLLLRCESEVI